MGSRSNSIQLVVFEERNVAMQTTELGLKSSMLDALRDIFPTDPLQFPEGQSTFVLREAAVNASLEKCYGNMIADSHILYIEESLFLSVPLMHMNTALQSFAGLREIMRRIGMPLVDASVKLDSLDSHYHPIK